MNPREAFDIASQWADTGAGACFYNFHSGDARPQSEAHRAECLAYLRALRASPRSAAEAAELAALEAFFASAELRPAD
jgi:hypothetical protein